jgi:hypothetical protein
MAAITKIAPNNQQHQKLETVAIVDQAAASTAVSKAVAVPQWARYATFVVDITTMTGTAPLFDFTVRGVNVADTALPDDGDLYVLGAGWDGITQKTAASTTTIHIGPDITTDDTGSATADDAYGVGAVLQPWLVYTYTTAGNGVSAEDYDATISVYWRA